MTTEVKEPGEIRVQRIVQTINRPDLKVWEVDLYSKYAIAGGWCDNYVTLHAAEYTLFTDDSKRGKWTKVVFDVPKEPGWHIIADCARYTCRFVAYREDR